MGKLCKFAVLRYVPDEIRKEFINVGLAFHCPEEGFIDMKVTTNFSRLSAFDDEVDVDLMKLILSGVKGDFTQLIDIGSPSNAQIRDCNYIDRATMMYVNQLQFSPVYTLRSSNIVEDYQDLFKTYVYFDSHKSNRITGEKVKSIMNRVLKDKNVLTKVHKDYTVDIGTEEVKIDYLYRVNDTSKLIKTFSFDYTDQGSKKAPSVAKEWHFNFSKLAENSTLRRSDTSRSDIEIITLVYTEKTNKNIEVALEILRESSKELVKARDPEAIERFADQITLELMN